MYINAGYLNNSRTDFKDNSTPLVVGSCGTYRLKTRPKLPTCWQKGRRDYQILYVANGKTHFWFDGREEIVSAGHMVLYKPEEIQKYVYYLEDNPEVFWIRNITKAVAEDEACHTVDFNITLTGFSLFFFQHLESMSDASLSLSEMEPYFSYYPDKLYKNLVETRVIYNGVLAQ